jgi:hypothetical protein
MNLRQTAMIGDFWSGSTTSGCSILLRDAFTGSCASLAAQFSVR